MLLGVGVVNMANTDHGFERRWLYYIRREVTISRRREVTIRRGEGRPHALGTQLHVWET